MALIESLNSKFAKLELDEALKVLRRDFNGRIAFSTSLGLEDQVITDAIFRNDLDIEVFTLDTGRNFPETYQTLEKTKDKYQKQIKVHYPQTIELESYATKHGINAMYDSVSLRKQCCYIRKIEPLTRALEDVEIWVTGLRAKQSDYRANIKLFAKDEQYNLLKFNPLLDWPVEKVWAYINQYEVPFNQLHNRGFPSIGCAPCTRAISVDEDDRSGRWWWEDKGEQECGLHYTGEKIIRRVA